MSFSKNLIKTLYLLVAVSFLSACSGLSDSVVQRFESLPDEIIKEKAFIETKLAAFNNLKTHKEWSFFQPYLEKEQWLKRFSEASDALKVAESLYDSKIVAMMDRDDPEDDIKARVLIKTFEYQVRLSRAAAVLHEKRILFLVNVRNSLENVYAKAKLEYPQLVNIENELTNRANKTITAYPHKANDIKKKISGLNVLVDKGAHLKKLVDVQYKSRQGNIDYAVFGDSAVKLSKLLIEATDYQTKIEIKFDELYRSYTKILADQKVDYFIVIGRATWCEGEYCGNGTTRHYPAKQVDNKTFEYFDTFTGSLIASLSTSWGRESFTIKTSSAAWNGLDIDRHWNSPRGDDYAEYWVEKTYTNTYHRYTEVVNDRMTQGPWVKVKEDDFWSQYNNLGMAVLSKPYGYYEEDALKDAQPVGMATMAPPVMKNNIATGRNQYGEWRQQNGNSFWHYYGMYSMFNMLTGRSRYSYNDWNSYSRHGRGRPYYGRNNEHGTWGSSTYNNSRYSNSDFAKRNPGDISSARAGTAGRSSRSASSIRGAGSSSRSRGPSGGGK